MRYWFLGAEVLAALIGLLVLALVLFALRRRWLSREGGTFECSLRLRTQVPGTGWALGVARYNDENLEWFRFFSYSLAPRQVFQRSQVNVLDSREPDRLEAVALYAGQRVVLIQTTSGSRVRTWELGMSSESLTGLHSWLEAAPPGVAGY